MSDRSDELRDRLPDTDRIRDRIREQREVGDDDLADSNDPDGLRYELRNLKGGDVADSNDPDGLRYELRNLKGGDVAGESELGGDVGLKSADTADAFVKYDGVDGESAAPEPNASLQIDEVPGESQRLVDGPAGTRWKVEEGEAGWKVEEGESAWAGGDDITGTPPRSVVDHKSDDFTGGRGLLVGDHAGHQKVSSTQDSVVDHKSDDFASKVVDHKSDDFASKVVDHKSDDFTADPDSPALKWNDIRLTESAPESVVDHKSDDFASKVVDHKSDDFASKVVDQKSDDLVASGPADVGHLEIEQTANYSYAETADPVGDALAPLDGGEDQFTALPELDASLDAAPPVADTDDLGDGF